MSWALPLAAIVSLVCFALAVAFGLWAAGGALPHGGRKGLARHVSRTVGATSAPSPMMLGLLSAILLGAAILPWGLALAPEMGRMGFVFPALGAAYLVVFLTHGAGAWSLLEGPSYQRNDRRAYAPLALGLAVGYAALIWAWFA